MAAERKVRRRRALISLVKNAGLVFAVAGIIDAGRRLMLHFTPRARRVKPGGIVVHHSATRPERQPFADAASIDREHREKGVRIRYNGRTYHIAYHYVILPDGRIEPGRPEFCRGAHTRSPRHNRWVGICLIGYFDPRWPDKCHHRPTKEQMDSLVRLSAGLMKSHGFDIEHILPHRDVNPTECPGKSFPMEEYLARVRAETVECPDSGDPPGRTAHYSNCQTFLVS